MSGRGQKDLTKAIKEYTENVQARLPVTPALLGNGYGTVEVPGRPGFVYVRPHRNPSQVLQVLCKSLHGSSGLPVLIGKPTSHQDENLLMVLDVDWAMYSMLGWTATGSSYLPQHGTEHTWGHSDPVPVLSRQIMDAALTATNPPSMLVYANRYRYWYNGAWETWAGGYSPNLSSAVPATGNRFLAFYIDPPTNTLRAATGTNWVLTPADYDDLIPQLPNGALPVGLVQLQSTTTIITDARIYELRLLWNHYGIDHTHSVPCCHIYNGAAVTVADAGGETTIPFDSERYDTDSMHNTGTNPERITFTSAGKYHVGCAVHWEFNAVGQRYLAARLNGVTGTFLHVDTAQAIASVLSTSCSLSFDYDFEADDYVVFRAWQNSGGNLDITQAANYTPEAWASKIG